MFLDRKPFIYLWRPIYRLVFEMVIHPLMMKLWTFFLLQPLPPSPPGNSMAAQLQEIERIRETLCRIDAALLESKQEWMATEKLILALMQEPGSRSAGRREASSEIDSVDRA